MAMPEKQGLPTIKWWSPALGSFCVLTSVRLRVLTAPDESFMVGATVAMVALRTDDECKVLIEDYQ